MSAGAQAPARPAATGDRRARPAPRLPVLGAFVATLWSAAGLVVLSGSLPESPLRLSRPSRLNLLIVSPQGWSFFTRDPREAVDHVYQKSGGGWVEALHVNSSPHHLFGVRRDARALSVELTALASGLPADAWIHCRSDLKTCLQGSHAAAAVRVSNISLTRLLCGEFAVERRPPVPWAWSRSLDRIRMPSRVLRLDVDCGAARSGGI